MSELIRRRISLLFVFDLYIYSNIQKRKFGNDNVFIANISFFYDIRRIVLELLKSNSWKNSIDNKNSHDYNAN